MAIVFKIKSSTPDENNIVKRRFHDALVGSPAYQNSEISICDGDDAPDNSYFYLTVGLDSTMGPMYDCHIDVDSYYFYYTDAEIAKKINGSDAVQGEAPIQIHFSAFTDNNIKKDADNEIDKVFCNFANKHPEFHFTSSAAFRKFPVFHDPLNKEPDCYSVVMSVAGTVPVDKINDFIQLSNCEDDITALCDGTNLCNANIKTLVNGQWH